MTRFKFIRRVNETLNPFKKVFETYEHQIICVLESDVSLVFNVHTSFIDEDLQITVQEFENAALSVLAVKFGIHGILVKQV